jgi:hypothetical protein
MMVNAKAFVSAILALLITAPVAAADTLTINGMGSWQAYVTPNENNRPYWDGNSDDSNQPATIGNFLTKTGFFETSQNTYSPGLDNPLWYGYKKGKAVANVNFSMSEPGVQMQLLVEVAGYAGSNVFGWYYTENNSITYRKTIFAGSDNAPSSNLVIIDKPAFGFYLYVASENKYYHTESKYNQTDANAQHFAFFRASLDEGPTTFWIGAEDLRLRSSDHDYNDMIIRVSAAPFPDSLVLWLTGLVGIGALGLRRRRLVNPASAGEAGQENLL